MTIFFNNEELHSWQKNFSFAIANYYWKAPSGKRICVVKEFSRFDQESIKHYKELEVISRFKDEEIKFWLEEFEKLSSPKYPREKREAQKNFTSLVFSKLWLETNEVHLLHFFIAAQMQFKFELGQLWDMDAELALTFSFRASLIFLFEILIAENDQQRSRQIANDYIEYCRNLNSKEMDYILVGQLKSEIEGRADHPAELFKKLNEPELGFWNELSRSQIIIYAANRFKPVWKYPANSMTLRKILETALVESGLPEVESFIQSFELKWNLKEERVA